MDMVDREFAERIVVSLMHQRPDWLGTIRERMAAGETYEQWRETFQRDLIDRVPMIGAIIAKRGGEPMLRMMWEISREKAAGGRS
jgi:hypothetical protein